jgi:hypothetical protein
MNIQSRDEALKDFREDPSVRILLLSLKAGGVALNLTVSTSATFFCQLKQLEIAPHLFFLDFCACSGGERSVFIRS